MKIEDTRLALECRFELLKSDITGFAEKGHILTMVVYIRDKFKEALILNNTANTLMYTTDYIEYLKTLSYTQIDNSSIIEQSIKTFSNWVYKHRLEYKLKNINRLYHEYATR